MPFAGLLAVAALGVLTDDATASARAATAGSDPYSPWHAQDQWWLNVEPDRMIDLHAAGAVHPVRVRRDGAAWRLDIGTAVLRGTGLRGSA